MGLWKPPSNTYPDGTTPEVCIVGAGFSGLTAGIKLKTDLNLRTFTIFDENEDVGGTWLVNTYPGCTCDIKSHLYSWSFELNPYWSQNYASQPEILEYIRRTARKYDLYRHIRLNTQVKNMVWNEMLRKWKVSIYNKETEESEELLFDIVLNGPGVLRVPHIPKEFEAFKGPVIHSGAWDKNVAWKGKTVAIVGSGSSAAQMITAMAPEVEELHCYQRRPAWVVPRRQGNLPKITQWIFAYVPFFILLIRWLLFFIHEAHQYIFINDSIFHKMATRGLTQCMDSALSTSPILQRKLKPNYPLGCKRILVSSEYLQTMTLPNIRLHRAPIAEVVADGIRTYAQDVPQKIDVLVLGTGFLNQDYFAPMTITGKNSENILDCFRKDPRYYLGLTCSNTPNLFALLGPNTGVIHTSVLFMLECQMKFIVQILREMMVRNARVVELTPEAEEEFHAELQAGLAKTVWSRTRCNSWFLNKKGVNTMLWPWNSIKYWHRTRKVNFKKFLFY